MKTFQEEAPTNIHSYINCAPTPQSFPIQAFVLRIKIKLEIIILQRKDVKGQVMEIFKESEEKESSKRIREKKSSAQVTRRGIAV